MSRRAVRLCFTLAVGTLVGASATDARASATVTFVTPTAGATLGNPPCDGPLPAPNPCGVRKIPIDVKASASPYLVTKVHADVGGVATDLALVGSDWTGMLANVPFGADTLTITVYDSSPATTTASIPFRKDDGPTTLDPFHDALPFFIGPHTTHLHLECYDDDPAGCASTTLKLHGDGAVLAASASGVVDVTPDLTAYLGQSVQFEEVGVDSAGQRTDSWSSAFVVTAAPELCRFPVGSAMPASTIVRVGNCSALIPNDPSRQVVGSVCDNGNVVWSYTTPSIPGTHYGVDLKDKNGVQTTLAAEQTNYTPTFDVVGDWLFWATRDPSGVLQYYRRDPAGTTTQLTASDSATESKRYDGMSPTGEVLMHGALPPSPYVQGYFRIPAGATMSTATHVMTQLPHGAEGYLTVTWADRWYFGYSIGEPTPYVYNLNDGAAKPFVCALPDGGAPDAGEADADAADASLPDARDAEIDAPAFDSSAGGASGGDTSSSGSSSSGPSTSGSSANGSNSGDEGGGGCSTSGPPGAGAVSVLIVAGGILIQRRRRRDRRARRR